MLSSYIPALKNHPFYFTLLMGYLAGRVMCTLNNFYRMKETAASQGDICCMQRKESSLLLVKCLLQHFGSRPIESQFQIFGSSAPS